MHSRNRNAPTPPGTLNYNYPSQGNRKNNWRAHEGFQAGQQHNPWLGTGVTPTSRRHRHSTNATSKAISGDGQHSRYVPPRHPTQPQFAAFGGTNTGPAGEYDSRPVFPPPAPYQYQGEIFTSRPPPGYPPWTSGPLQSVPAFLTNTPELNPEVTFEPDVLLRDLPFGCPPPVMSGSHNFYAADLRNIPENQGSSVPSPSTNPSWLDAWIKEEPPEQIFPWSETWKSGEFLVPSSDSTTSIPYSYNPSQAQGLSIKVEPAEPHVAVTFHQLNSITEAGTSLNLPLENFISQHDQVKAEDIPKELKKPIVVMET